MKNFKPLDFLAVLFVLACGAVCLYFSAGIKGQVVLVESEKGSFEYSLNDNGQYKVQGPLGETVIEVKDNKVRIVDSPCPGKTCMNQGWGTTLVCLPNKVIVTVEASGGFDAIAE